MITSSQRPVPPQTVFGLAIGAAWPGGRVFH
jgi:hypothetical protein